MSTVHNILLWTSLVMIAPVLGCAQGRSSTHELEHVQPAHWPCSLMDAADKLEQRASRLGDSTNDQELREIVSWLPEVAADTEIAESRWNELNQKCESLSELLTEGAVDQSRCKPEIERLIGSLRAWHTELPDRT